jgi:HlyD family secretion protein
MKHKGLLIAAGAVAVVVLAALPRLVRGPEIAALRLAPKTLVQTVAATGRVRAPGRLELASEVAGVITQVRCQEGLRVKAGDVLYALRDDEARAQLDEADAQLRGVEARYEELAGTSRKGDEESLKRAEIALADTADRLGRLERLLAQGAVEAAQVEEARRKRDQAASQLESARATVSASGASGARVRQLRAQLDEARARRALSAARLARTKIDAPAPGLVSSCRGLIGDVVGAGQGLMTLVLDGPIELVIEPDEKNLALLELGQAATASVDAFADQPFSAKVSLIVPAVDPLRGTVEVRLVAEQPPSFLVPDMTVAVEVVVRRKADALVVPRDAVRDAETTTPWVLVHESGAAARREVKIGIRGDAELEVKEGLRSGEIVLLPGRKLLTSGTTVRAALSEG